MIGVGVAGHQGTVAVTSNLAFAPAFLAVTDIVRGYDLLLPLFLYSQSRIDLCVRWSCCVLYFHRGDEGTGGMFRSSLSCAPLRKYLIPFCTFTGLP